MEEENKPKEEIKEEIVVEQPKPKGKMDPEVIGIIKDKSKGSPIIILVVFGLLIIAILFLPKLSDYLEKNNVNLPFNNTTNQIDNTIPIEEEEVPTYPYQNGMTIVYENNSYSDIKIVTNDTTKTIQFEITNKSDKAFSFVNHKTFIELYSSDKTLLQRIKVSLSTNLEVNQKTVGVYDIDIDDITLISTIKIIEYTTDDYPLIELSLNEEKQQELVCSKGIQTTKFQFEEEKLVRIVDKVSYPIGSDVDKYASDLLEYKELSKTLNNITGMTSTIVETEDSFVYNAAIDLKVAKVKILNNPYYYEKGTSARIISFELEASNFDCR